MAELTDGSAADFAAGTTDAGAYIAHTRAGEVILLPKVAGEFTGDTMPAGWTVTPLRDGGSATLAGGMLTLDAARVGCEPLLLSPRSLEMSAVFAARPDQHVGLGTNFVDVPWVKFSTKWGRRLYARTHLLTVEDKRLAGDFFDAPHRYRIDWNVLDLIFWVDGEKVAHLMIPMPGHMRAMAANERLGAQPLGLEWVRLSPYPPAGRFTSRVLDAGAPADWHSLTWRADEPRATGIAMQVRTGDVARPGRTWSSWRAVAGSGGAVGATSRFVQYRALLSTTDPAWTPVLHEVRLRYSAAGAPGGGSAAAAGAGGGVSSSSLVSGSALGCQ